MKLFTFALTSVLTFTACGTKAQKAALNQTTGTEAATESASLTLAQKSIYTDVVFVLKDGQKLNAIDFGGKIKKVNRAFVDTYEGSRASCKVLISGVETSIDSDLQVEGKLVCSPNTLRAEDAIKDSQVKMAIQLVNLILGSDKYSESLGGTVKIEVSDLRM
jgi:hypothetical protein